MKNQAVVEATPDTKNWPAGVANRLVFLRAISHYAKNVAIIPTALGYWTRMPKYI